jgi:hypothetical protein
VLEVGEQAPLLLVGDQRQAGAHEPTSAHAEPAAVDLEPIAIGHLEAIELEGNAIRSGGCRSDSLCHEDPQVTRICDPSAYSQSALQPRAGLGAPHARRARLLARAGVAVQRTALDGLVDRLDQLAMLDLRLVSVAGRHRRLEAAEERLDLGGVAAVLESLAFGAQDPLLL